MVTETQISALQEKNNILFYMSSNAITQLDWEVIRPPVWYMIRCMLIQHTTGSAAETNPVICMRFSSSQRWKESDDCSDDTNIKAVTDVM